MNNKPKKETTQKPFFNRELSWLDFNARVLEQASNERYPLLERVRYLSFFSSNLDEFYEIRVSGLMQQAKSEVTQLSMDGLTPKEQLEKVNDLTHELVKKEYHCWKTKIVPGLKKEGIIIKPTEELAKEELAWLDKYFKKQVYPTLTPLVIDHAHPFPHFTNKGLNILVHLAPNKGESDEDKMALIPVPRILPRIISIGGRKYKNPCYVFLSDILRNYADKLFPGYKVLGSWEFRISRNSDLYIDEEEVENLLDKIEEELHKLQKGAAVRLEIRKGIPKKILNELLEAIELEEKYVFQINGPLNLLRLFSLYDLVDSPDLKFPSFMPHVPQALHEGENIFECISREDLLLHHPYDSFAPVVNFIQEAARDPLVFAIKQTLYRTSGESPIVKALKEASRNGKQVTALIELKARFDEANNIEWARQLEDAGVHVVYGIPGLKTHCKCCLIVRRENKGLKQYVHLGTGNYNPKTARTYTDISLLTKETKVTCEVAALFNTLTGFVKKPYFKKILVAPFNLHQRMQELINQEAANARTGKKARIVLKMNSLADEETILNLYKASQAGVDIDLIIRGICCLIPGVNGLSENIKVRSILGRYLEHHRIFYFENASQGDPQVLVGSSDWMPRNFYRRIETVFPIENSKLKQRMIGELLNYLLADNTEARILTKDGNYDAIKKKKGAEAISAQDTFLKISEAHKKRSENSLEESEEDKKS